ncbi:MAG TPA: RsmG family class I SAM-dependent methyltransferase [Acidimicrobiales bacterium]|nr:RsmG family class I SAM-dependent methyltransferase [Acidimicrobiales bacterium]
MTTDSGSAVVIGDAHLEVLRDVLETGRRQGFLGPGPVEAHIRRSLHFLEALPTDARLKGGCPTKHALELYALDLGSGGGVPGLVLALALPVSRWVLLEASRKRSAFLAEAVRRLDLEGRVSVAAERAEEAGLGPLRGSFDLVVARSFAAPAVTAECGAPFLRSGGLLIVAEPPANLARSDDSPPATAPPSGGPVTTPASGGPAPTPTSGGLASSAIGSPVGEVRRWPPEPLALLGLAPLAHISVPSALQVLEQRTLCPSRYPRRTGIPTKRPLF